MFRLTRFSLCASSLPSPAAAGKWSETTMNFGSGVPAPAAPGSNPYSMAELKVPTSALRIKNRLTLDTKTRSKKRQPVQLQPGPRLTPVRVPSCSSMVSLDNSIESTKGDLEMAQNVIARLWGQKPNQQEQEEKKQQELNQKNNENNNNKTSSSDLHARLEAARKRKEKIREQQSLLDTDSFCPEDGVNGFVHKSLNCHATFSGIVVDVTVDEENDDDNVNNDTSNDSVEGTQSQSQQQHPTSFTILVKEDENSGILLKVLTNLEQRQQTSSNDQSSMLMMNNTSSIEVGANVVVTGSLRMKRIVYKSEESEQQQECNEKDTSSSSGLLPSHFSVPILRRTKPIIRLPSKTGDSSSSVEDMLSKIEII